jgi:Holliday junction resolvase-like predicted endonuclease
VERTGSQRAGDAAESLVAERLVRAGWSILGRNVHAGRSELDIVAVDPGPPARLVVVEVRWRRSREFGRPEETFDRRKQSHVRAGLARLLERRCLPNGEALPNLPVAIDLAVVEPGPDGQARIRLCRDALAG